ncbi:putative tyrosinase [Podospora australis]|uniref:Tyrosinase n=1 Tax=Podospora australis TaxID=1536484 RepID=A0AAN6WZ32_9PEZI|nr:putative tyrosinase [Podospora australis]
MWKTVVCIAVALPWTTAQWLRYSNTTTSIASPVSSIPTPTPILVTGVKTGIDNGTGQPPPRLNINLLSTQAGPQWDLYILALSELQALNETDETSYFALAGIHGFPHSAWNGVGHVDGAPVTGFCPHGELLFLTWHRPYVALFEQILVARAVAIASRYPPSLHPQYVAAAQSLRQPFWDWAAHPLLPDAATSPTISVTAPGGVTEIPNPLYNYRYQRPDVEHGFGGWLATKPQTFRCLGSGDMLNNASESNLQLNSSADYLKSSIYDIFTRVTSFEEMRNMSFENPHNLVHLRAACNGTLADINWSAFEPIFMLHHTNVDRLFAMWQTIHYASPITFLNTTSGGQFATPKGTVITADSPLKPFFSDTDNLKFHTSNSVANISTFGYSYQDDAPWGNLDAESRADFVRGRVNSLYGGDGGNSAERIDEQTANRLGKPDDDLKDYYYYYYTAEISVDRAQIPLLPATVGLVVAASGQIVGRVPLLAMPCEGVVEVSVPLADLRLTNNKTLLAGGEYGREVVAAVLGEVLGVEIQGADGTQIPVSNVPSVKVALQAVQYTPRSNTSDFPTFGNSERWELTVKQNDFPVRL